MSPAAVSDRSSTPTRAVALLVPLIRTELAAGADHYRKAGTLLLEAKRGMKHGAWLPWLKTHFGLSQQTASVYMRLAHQQTTGRTRNVEDATRTGRVRRVRDMDEDKVSIRLMARDLIDAGHRALAVKHHPDKPSGSVELMTRVNRAREVLVRLIQDW